MFISVLLPAPFSPSRAWISPDSSSKSTWSFATTPGNALTIPLAATAGVADAWGAAVIGPPLARRRGLAGHEPEQAHRLRIGVEVLVAGLVGLGLDLRRDPNVFGSPDPVGGGQAVVDLARRRVVVRDGPLALFLGDVGDGTRIGA